LEQELDLRALLQVLAGGWKIILAITVLAVLISALLTFYYLTPNYQASSTVMVVQERDTPEQIYDDVRTSRQLVETYQRLISSMTIMDEVIEILNLDYSFNKLEDMVEVNQKGETEIIEISATHQEPQKAARISNQVAEVFQNKVGDFYNIENVNIIDRARTPESPVSPRPNLNLAVAAVLGLMAGTGLVFLKEALDNTVKSKNELEQIIPVPILGIIPKQETVSKEKTKKKKSSLQSKPAQNLEVISDHRSPVTEAFRAIRSNLEFASLDQKVKTLMMTSPDPNSGKSSSIANLGSVLSQTGARVLLVDADLRKPTLHSFFRLSNRNGLTSLLVNKHMELKEAVQVSFVDNLYLLTSGPLPPNPAELMGTEKMKELVGMLAENYDYVLYDTPPLNAVIDAAVLARLVDASVMIVRYGGTSREEIQHAWEQLKSTNTRVIGSILNEVPAGKHGHYYYYYRYE